MSNFPIIANDYQFIGAVIATRAPLITGFSYLATTPKDGGVVDADRIFYVIVRPCESLSDKSVLGLPVHTWQVEIFHLHAIGDDLPSHNIQSMAAYATMITDGVINGDEVTTLVSRYNATKDDMREQGLTKITASIIMQALADDQQGSIRLWANGEYESVWDMLATGKLVLQP